MKKLLILSGKGGTGKTTTAATLIQFAKAKAIADCDVDAPNLHLVTSHEKQLQHKKFFGGDKAFINEEKCTHCGKCQAYCRFHAIEEKEKRFTVNEFSCEGCGLCERVCPSGAIEMRQDEAGTLDLYQDEACFSTAKLKMGRGNSGKLVSEVKMQLFQAVDDDTELAIVDGSPGIGCPVLSSISGMDMVLIVAEPSRSGFNDCRRLLETIELLQAKAVVCVNKWDINEAVTNEIIAYCKEKQIPFAGKIPYDPHASVAMNHGQSLAEIPCKARDALWEVYQRIREELK